MATDASKHKSRRTGQKQRSRHKRPISSHPAFPAIVALWFAALFGTGSLIVPVGLFEKLVSITGLSAILPSTQPPLGVTARLIITLSATGIGLVAGLLLARQVAAAQTAAVPSPSRGGKIPISAMDELGAKSLDQPVDELPFSRPPVSAPVEHDDDNALELTEIDAPADDESPAASNPGDDAPDFLEEANTAFGGNVDVPAEIAANTPDPKPEATPAECEHLTAEQLISRPLDQLSIVHLVERFALSLQRTSAAPDLANAISGAKEASDASGNPQYGMNNHAYQEVETPPRRFDPPKAVTGAAPPESANTSSAETEHALRAALAKLEKLSGVG